MKRREEGRREEAENGRGREWQGENGRGR